MPFKVEDHRIPVHLKGWVTLSDPTTNLMFMEDGTGAARVNLPFLNIDLRTGNPVEVIGEVTEARAAMMGAKTPQERIDGNARLDGALGRLMVVVENYPNIKANENFLRLQDELAGTENRIAVERRRYNDTIQDYNTYIALFPNSLVAGFAGFARNDAYFKTEEGARQAPKVNFDFNKPAAAPAQQAAPAHP